jgi:methionine-rich copper-binding protein CopC
MVNVKIGMLAVAVAFSLASAADAHPQLKSAGPAPGSVVKASPKALRIQFNEGIVLGFSGVEVTDAAGKKQPVGEASLSATDKNQLIVPLTAELAPGKYTVAWHAVGDDTHKVDGKYSFEVKP